MAGARYRRRIQQIKINRSKQVRIKNPLTQVQTPSAVKTKGVIIMSTAKLFQLPLPYKTKSTATQVTVLWL